MYFSKRKEYSRNFEDVWEEWVNCKDLIGEIATFLTDMSILGPLRRVLLYSTAPRTLQYPDALLYSFSLILSSIKQYFVHWVLLYARNYSPHLFMHLFLLFNVILLFYFILIRKDVFCLIHFVIKRCRYRFLSVLMTILNENVYIISYIIIFHQFRLFLAQ